MGAPRQGTFGRLSVRSGNANVAGSIVDKDSGEQVPARVQVTESAGNFVSPDDAILKIGQGAPFFYSDGRFAVAVNRGPTRIVVERGTEYVPAVVNLEAPSQGTVTVDIEDSFVFRRPVDAAVRQWHREIPERADPTALRLLR